MVSKRFAGIRSCPLKDRAGQSVATSLNGALLRSRSPFPYYMVLALEAGSPLRALLLLLVCPFVWCIWHVMANQGLALQVLIFISTAGIRLSEVIGVSKAVLPKFFLEDLHSQCFEVLTSCSKRHVVTSYPRIMVEYSLIEHVGVDEVLGTELQVSARGYCTGLVETLMLGQSKAQALRRMFAEEGPDLGLGSGATDIPFLTQCKEAYIVEEGGGEVSRDKYCKPLVFHDGRLVVRPTPWVALTLFLWAPFGLLLALARIIGAMCLPGWVAYPCAWLLGISLRVKGTLPRPLADEGRQTQGLLLVCNHRTLLDPTFMCIGLGRRIRALTYSLSWISELISPIPIAQLTRDRKQDARLIAHFLEREGHLVVCPEGTTCREPYLLRFSSLFAELTDHIVPVAIKVKTTMFWGSSARGYKALDAFFFLMNPRPTYEICFLDRLGREQTVAGGKSSVEVAKMVQKQIAEALGYVCTEWTRKDKYIILAGHDGTVKDKRAMRRPSGAAASGHDAPIHCSGARNGDDDDKSF